jgi:hypothetical protein
MKSLRLAIKQTNRAMDREIDEPMFESPVENGSPLDGVGPEDDTEGIEIPEAVTCVGNVALVDGAVEGREVGGLHFTRLLEPREQV